MISILEFDMVSFFVNHNRIFVLSQSGNKKATFIALEKLQPPPHAGLVAGVRFPKLFLQIRLFLLDDQRIHQEYE